MAFARLGKRGEPPRRRLGPAAASVLLHALVLVGLILAARQRLSAPPRWLPPPSVKMLFQGGGGAKPAVPNKAPREANRPASPPPLPVSPSQTAPRAPSPPAPRPARAPPAPASPPSATPRLAARLPLPPPRPLPPTQARARPAPVRFPPPTAFSLHAAPARTAPAHRPGRTIDLSFAPHGGGAEQLALAGILDHDGVGPDWSNAFSAWLARHTYYPHDAGILGEHGDVVVSFIVSRDGRVSGLRLRTSSGHPILDMATLGMFRDAKLPPLPPQDGDRLPIHFTMHYVIHIIRQ